MDLDRRVLFLAPLVLALCGFNTQPLPPQWNGGHPESLNPLWDLLSATPTDVDRKSGLITAQFDEGVKRLAGKPLKIDGFMLPLEEGRETIHFALTRRNAGCPFCPPNKPTEAVEVILLRPIRVTGDLVTVQGDLVLHPSSAEGMFFQLRRAEVA